MRRRLTPAQWTILGIGVFGVLLALMVHFDTNQLVLQLLQWLETQGLSALLWFILFIALVVLSLMPGVLFTTGAGFVFGVAQANTARESSRMK